MVVEEPHPADEIEVKLGPEADVEAEGEDEPAPAAPTERGKTVHGEAANAGHRVLAPDDAEVEAYLETALNAPTPHRPAVDRPVEPDAVIVLDFGSQFAQLIARRVRELNVYSELLPHDTAWSEIQRRAPRAIILSGARHRLTLFLAQYWGGPTTYDQERGHPRLRMRHAPFLYVAAEQRDLHRIRHVDTRVLQQRGEIVGGGTEHGVLEIQQSHFGDAFPVRQPHQVG